MQREMFLSKALKKINSLPPPLGGIEGGCAFDICLIDCPPRHQHDYDQRPCSIRVGAHPHGSLFPCRCRLPQPRPRNHRQTPRKPLFNSLNFLKFLNLSPMNNNLQSMLSKSPVPESSRKPVPSSSFAAGYEIMISASLPFQLVEYVRDFQYHEALRTGNLRFSLKFLSHIQIIMYFCRSYSPN